MLTQNQVDDLLASGKFKSVKSKSEVNGAVLSVHTENLKMGDLPKLLEKLGK